MVTNLCPDGGSGSWCTKAGEINMAGFYHHFDMSTITRIFNGDPWDNPIVHCEFSSPKSRHSPQRSLVTDERKLYRGIHEMP